MPGKFCPNCGKLTLFESPIGKSCSACGYKIRVPVNGGMGGRGKKCPVCNKWTVFNNKCRNCGSVGFGGK